jgi:hypothetical protein
MRAVRRRSLAAMALPASMLLVACGGATPVTRVTPETPVTPAAPAALSAKGKSPGLVLVKGTPLLPPAANALNDAIAEGAPKTSAFSMFQRSPMGVPRAAVEPHAFRVADLPRAEIPEPLPPSQAPIVSTEGELATDIFVDWESAFRSTSMIGRPEAYTSVRVSLRGQNLARIRIGNNEGTVAQGAGGGVYVVCRVPEDALRRFVTARWESLSASPKGEPALSIVDAWFDMHTCKATIVRRTRVPLQSLAGGVFLGYREACSKCATGERVMFIAPHPQHVATSGVGGEATVTTGALTRVALNVRRGGGGSLVARYSAGVLRDWHRSLGKEVTSEADVVAGIDIAQGVEDQEPVAVAYASKAIPPAASAPAPERPAIRIPKAGSKPPPMPTPPRPTVRLKPSGKPSVKPSVNKELELLGF